MALVDIILSAILAVSVLLGLWRGLLYEVLSVLAWVAAWLVARHGVSWLAPALPLAGWGEGVREVLAFAALFVGTLFAGGVLAWLAQRGAASVGLRPIDRLLGGLFGALRGVLVLLLLALLVHQTPWRDATAWREAQGPQWLDQGLVLLRGVAPQALVAYFP
jgi:membrane protein required for colicin V production